MSRLFSRKNKSGRITIGHGWIHIIWKRLEGGLVIDQIIEIPFMTPRYPSL